MLKVKLDNLIFEAKLIYFLKMVTGPEYPETLLDYDYYIFDGISKTEFDILVEICRERSFLIRHPVSDGNDKSSVYWSEDFNGSSINKYIKDISKVCKFKTRSTLPRGVILQVSEFIVKNLDRPKIIKAVSVFESPIEIKKYFESKDSVNSLVFDLLFYYSFSEEDTLLDILVEFLNPSYYVIGSDVTPQKTFEIIDGILKVSIGVKDYSCWKKKSLKYANENPFINSVNKSTSISKSKTSISISRVKGISCNVNGENTFYPRLKPTSKIFKSIIFLVEKDKPIEISDLAKHTKQKEDTVKASIERVNGTSKRIFDIKYDLIKDADNGIYFMNKDDYIFL
jgi:hypothetical protein